MTKKAIALVLALFVLFSLCSCYIVIGDKPTEDKKQSYTEPASASNNDETQPDTEEDSAEEQEPDTEIDESSVNTPASDEDTGEIVSTPESKLVWKLINTEYKIGSDVDDGWQHYRSSYEGVVDGGYLRMVYSGGYYDEHPELVGSHCTRIYECSQPPAYFEQNAALSVTLRIVVQDKATDKPGDLVWVPGTDFTLDTGWNKFRFVAADGDEELYTGAPNNKPYAASNIEMEKTFYLTFPPEKEVNSFHEGHTVRLRWNCGAGWYEWTYQLR